jgi:hypothetical protein
MRHIRTFLLGVSVLVGAATIAGASTLTLNFSGNLDLTASGGAAVNPFSGFFTWDPDAIAFEEDPPTFAIYPIEAYQLILNGVDRTGSHGGGLFVVNDGDLFGTGNNVDALMLFAVLESDPVIGDTAFIAALSAPDAWDTTSLPTDYSFLPLLPDRFSGMSLEVPNEGDENDILLGRGSLAVSVPEPASLSVTALGFASILACARRSRQRS